MYYEMSISDTNFFTVFYQELYTVQECTLQEMPRFQCATRVAVITSCTSHGS